MIGRYFFGALMAAILVAFASLTAVAQVGELRGHVWMQQADGQKVPVADAQIDVFRTDMQREIQHQDEQERRVCICGLAIHRHLRSRRQSSHCETKLRARCESRTRHSVRDHCDSR